MVKVSCSNPENKTVEKIRWIDVWIMVLLQSPTPTVTQTKLERKF